jgi:hypothetical protein
VLMRVVLVCLVSQVRELCMQQVPCALLVHVMKLAPAVMQGAFEQPWRLLLWDVADLSRGFACMRHMRAGVT